MIQVAACISRSAQRLDGTFVSPAAVYSTTVEGLLAGSAGPPSSSNNLAGSDGVVGLLWKRSAMSRGREVGSDHYAYKLDWFDALAAAVAAGPPDVAQCGDMNVAPADADVFDPPPTSATPT